MDPHSEQADTDVHQKDAHDMSPEALRRALERWAYTVGDEDWEDPHEEDVVAGSDDLERRVHPTKPTLH